MPMKLSLHNITASRMTLILVGVNLAVFLAVALAGLFGANAAANMLALPSDPESLMLRPWTLLSYMFTQWNAIHLIVNMLWLWLWARVIEMTPSASLTATSVRILGAYLAGGVAGAAVYLGASLAGGDCGVCLTGSSASVVAVIASGAVAAPRAEVNLVLFGRVRLLWAAAVSVGLCLLGDLGAHTGSALAHLGGVAAGAVCGLWYARSDARPRRQPRGIGNSGDDRADLDAILAKVSRSGYGSLSSTERKRLFEISKRLS